MRVLISLLRETGDAVRVTLSIGNEAHTCVSYPSLPLSVVEATGLFLRGIRADIRGDAAEAERNSQERSLARLGHALRVFCLPGDSGEALSAVVDGAIGTTVEVCFEAEDPTLLGLPFEALRLPDDRTLALQRSVVMFRRPTGVRAADGEPLAGPVKVLVAVGAPDKGTSSVPLDQERELQNILDAVTVAQRHENFDVRILEVGSPGQIADAIGRDAYHVLHISCHGRRGALELENEDGQAVQTTAAELVDPIRRTHRPLPLVLLNACDGGVAEGQTASLAEALLRAGVPAVLAMQTWVSDFYAIEFARAFYHHLSSRDYPLASRALASARKELERARQEAVGRGAPLVETQPEFATASLYVAGKERPLADFAREKEPLRLRPVCPVAGSVPQLGIDELIGRRNEQRETLRTLRDWPRQYAGVVLTGIGGAGKSAVAGRVMQRLSEAGWLLSAHVGRFDLKAVGDNLGTGLLQAGRPQAVELGRLLAADDVDDEARLQLVAQALAEVPVLLVLDDFEQNLKPGGGEFLDPGVDDYLRLLAGSAGRGRLLLTCRHPVPGMDDLLWRVPVGPLSRAETQKLLLRLDALRGRDPSDLAMVVRVIGGHPRMLEFLDALLRGGRGRLPHVTKKLRDVLTDANLDAAAAVTDLDEGLSAAVALGARDVLLSELLDIARSEGIDEALLQTAASNLPVEPAGLARMLTDGGEGDPASAMQALAQLEDLSLVHSFADGSAWVHRWTAEGLAGLVDADERRARHLRAGRYRSWRVHEGHGLEDAVEAMRNFLTGEDFDAAVDAAQPCFDTFRRFRQSIGLAALASEILETLPPTHPGFIAVANEEAEAHLTLGFTNRAFVRYRNLLERQEALVQAEPDRADYQRDLSLAYERVGEVYSALGQGEQARRAFLTTHHIRKRLALTEPDRADYQRDLAFSFRKVGDLYRAHGQGEQARHAFLSSFQIRERLALAEPDRADYQRDLSVGCNKVGDLYRSLGQGEQARQALLTSLHIRERLALAEPDRADYQRDLSVAYDKVGNLYRTVGQGEQAGHAFLSSLQIRECLALAEPDRADYQRDLSVAYNRVGDLYRTLGRGEQAHHAFLSSLQIRKRLALAEPDRADYQRDLAAVYQRVGDLYRDLGQGEQARHAFLSCLQIVERLALAEPDRADYQRDLFVSHAKIGDLYRRDLGQGEQARHAFLTSLQIAERLALAEPDRAYYQRDLAIAYNRVGDLYRDLGLGEQARQAFLTSLQIAERLAQAEPDRADYQRDLSISYNKVGDLYRTLGQGEQARHAFLSSLQIRECLARAEPDRTDYQRDLAAAYQRVGDLYRDLGQGEQARQAFVTSLQIVERLALAEPDRADYQRDLSVAYDKVGNLYRTVGQGEQARHAFLASLHIRERLALAEPDRADYQRYLSISYNKVGDLYRDLGQGEQARQAFLTSLQIAGRLAQAEPYRADYQRYLAESYQRIGDMYRDLGQGEQARHAFLSCLQIVERLALAEPDRADHQRDLVTSLVRVGTTDDDVSAGMAKLRRALAILTGMKERGQLAPVNDAMGGWVKGLLDKMEGGGG